MDLTITSTRTCASMPGHQLCLDYTLPAVEKIFARFLQHHSRIPEYTNCRFSKHQYPHKSTIACSSGSYQVEAEEESYPSNYRFLDPKLTIKVSKITGGNSEYEELKCTKKGCDVTNSEFFHYAFQHHYFSNSNSCLESISAIGYNAKSVPCDAGLSYFDDYLNHATVALDPPQQLFFSNQNGAQNLWSAFFGNSSSQNTGTSGNPTPQNTSYFQTGLGAAATVVFGYKAYKEMEKMDEEGRRVAAARLKMGKPGEAAPKAIVKEASGWRALGYVGLALGAGTFTLYSLKA
jgi:hypothetical protein